jgi:uncharacterized protein involved in exopolysaccharide biosynthesis
LRLQGGSRALCDFLERETLEGETLVTMWSGERTVFASTRRLRVFGATLWIARWRLAAWCAVCMGACLIYVVTAPPQFVARVDVAIAPWAIANDGPEDLRHFHQIDLDSEQAATELQVLTSERVLRPVFDNLKLAQLPELLRGRDGVWATLAHVVHYFAPDWSPYDDRDRAYFAFVDRVRCLRLGLSYVFEMSYRSRDPQLAARVANAVAAEYLADRIDRERMRRARIGGAYQAARHDALMLQLQSSRAAARSGVAPAEDLYGANARLLGTASPPLTKTYPKIGPTLAMGAGIGLLSGVLATLGLGFRLSATSARWARDLRHPA